MRTYLILRNALRQKISNRIIENLNRNLPSIRSIQEIDTIDSEVIIELNNSTSSERRIELVNEIINSLNSQQNLNLLINNAPVHVLENIRIILNNYCNSNNISIKDLNRIGNILLYHLANISSETINLSEFIDNLRISIIEIENNFDIIRINDLNSNLNDMLYRLNLLTENQLNRHVLEFQTQIEERENSMRNERSLIIKKQLFYTVNREQGKHSWLKHF